MATTTVMMDRTSVISYFSPPLPGELVKSTGQFRYPVHCAPLGTPSRRICQCSLRLLWGSPLSAQASKLLVAFFGKDPTGTVSAPMTPDTTYAGIRTHVYEHQSPVNHRPSRHVHEKDNLIIAKYSATRLVKTYHYNNLDLIGINSHVIIHISPRHHVPMCLPFTYKGGTPGHRRR